MVCARSQTRQLFHLTGLDRQLHLARTLTEALQALTAPGTPTCELAQPAPASGTPADPASSPAAGSGIRPSAHAHAIQTFTRMPGVSSTSASGRDVPGQQQGVQVDAERERECDQVGPRRGSVQDPEREVLAWDPVVLDRGPRARHRYGRLPATA